LTRDETMKIVRPEGLALGPEQREATITAALAVISTAVMPFAAREAA
jgi:hypothetical protein